MKHCVCFKLGTKNYELRAKKAVPTLLLLSSCLLLLTGCVKHDEIAFRGTIVDTRECNLSFGSYNDAGFVVNLDTPDSIGRPYTYNGHTYGNTVVLYDPDCRLYKGDKISGTFYLDDKYSRANCSVHYNLELPEGVFVSITVE